MFYFSKIQGREILKSDLLSDVTHFFTTRNSFMKTGDKEYESIVEENRKIIKQYFDVDELVTPTQTHSKNIAFAQIGQTDYPQTDALILTNKKQGIYLNFADCTPVILYDKKQHIAAISHAGWRGTAQKIVPETIKKMNSNPKDIIAVIGPAIGMCCYQVGEDVFNKLKNTVEDFSSLSKGLFVDLKGINAQQLKEIGVEQIDVCPYCTSCDNDKFFSYRKENGTTNRHNAVVIL